MPLLIFDLDGTLIDSKLDLANSVNAMLGHMGMPVLTNETVYSYVGNGAPVLVRKALGPSASDADVSYALDYFLSYYREHMLDYTHLYPGVREALERMREQGAAMAVLTNKPVRFSQAIVDGLGVADFFFQVYGGNSFETKKPEPTGARKLVEESGQAPESAWMVGDSAVDIRTARNAGIGAVGVSYGFQPEGFLEYPPDLVVDDLRELAGWLGGRLGARNGVSTG
jgi:phosphoglycolate phosphatase